MRLLGFELAKIGARRSFLLSICALMILNGFLLWYTNLPDGERPGLSAYGAFQEEIAGMTETQKGQYISGLKETMDGVRFVEEVLMLQGMSGEMGEMLSAQALAESPGLFEAYYEVYQSGAYLKFTDSLWLEGLLVDELHEEWKTCAEYGTYLQSVQEKKNTLGGVKIFGGGDKDSFSARNIEKSARDYGRLGEKDIRWMPEKSVVGAMENPWTDLLLLLSVAFFVGYLILEEKEKRLFYVIRSTRKGILPGICAKLAALLVHCMVLTGLFYGANLLFYGQAAGFGDLSADLVSLAAFRESCIQVSVREYLILSILTKGLAFFGFGAVLTALCIASTHSFAPYIAGGLWYGGSCLLYATIPAASRGALFKYLNLAGSLRTENLYGAYLNLNVFGRPMSRTALTLGLTLLRIVTGVSLSALLFARGEAFELRARRYLKLLPFRPHANLLLHESYKIMVMNRAAFVLLLFAVLSGGRSLSRQYSLSVQEQYYQGIMLQLEGELTQEKEALVLTERERYDQAFAEIGRIDEMMEEGEIDMATGEDMKSRWYAVTAFYPAFSRVWQQYENLSQDGGEFLYDTGYLYLFGARGDGFRTDFMLLSCCMVLAFGGAMAMEDGKGAWNLLGATRAGRRKILLEKTVACVLAAMLLSFAVYACRAVSIARAFPLRGFWFPVKDIPYCGQFPAWISVGGMTALLALSQAFVCAMATLSVLLLSCWRKDSFQAYLFGTAVLVVPLALGMLKFSFADAFSLYPLYSWTASL